MDHKVGSKLIIASICCFAICYAATLTRHKREAFQLPDGVQAYIPAIKPNFKCSSGGYFADIENDCKIFHVCVPGEMGKTELQQYSFACGNQTVFNQFSMTCTSPDEAVPCASSKDFWYLNERIGKEKELIHNDMDIEKLASYLGSKDE